MVAPKLLLFCILAISVSAFFPYYPEYKCAEDGACLGLSERKAPTGVHDRTPGLSPGVFRIKIEQTPPTDDVPLDVRVARYADRLSRQHGKRANAFGIAKSNKPTLPNSNAIDQDGTDFSYTTNVYVGSKNKPLRMLVDTGAANSWIMGSTCTNSPCTIHDTFGQEDSNTYNATTDTFLIQYGTGSVSGQYVVDTFGLAGFSLPITFGVADKVSDEFNNYPMDGILGLSRIPDAKNPSFVEVLIGKKLLASNIFSVNIQRATDELNDGEITFGGVDSTKYTGSITYTDIVKPGGAWVIPVDKAGFNGKDSGLQGKIAIIDTGTTYCFIPPWDAAAFYATVPGSQVSEDGHSYSVPCETKVSAEFTFSGTKFSIPPGDWIGGQVGTSCTSNIYSRNTTQDGSWLLGDTFLKSVYAVFDLDENRIGLASKPVHIKPTSTSSTAIHVGEATQKITSTNGLIPSSTSDNSSPIDPTGATMTSGSQGFNSVPSSPSSHTATSGGSSAAAAGSASEPTTAHSSASSFLNTHYTLYITAFTASVAMFA